MVPPSVSLRVLALVTSILSPCLVAAQTNYTQLDMMRAQLALYGDRPSDCPPW